jgi:hypothetical protein
MLYSYLGAISVSKLTAVGELSASDISYKCNGGEKRERERERCFNLN